jgi:hypothetical protein
LVEKPAGSLAAKLVLVLWHGGAKLLLPGGADVNSGKWFAVWGERRFEIEADLPAGYYLYVFDHEKCVADHLQDTLEYAKEQAEDEYGVPTDAWQEFPQNQPDG